MGTSVTKIDCAFEGREDSDVKGGQGFSSTDVRIYGQTYAGLEEPSDSKFGKGAAAVQWLNGRKVGFISIGSRDNLE